MRGRKPLEVWVDMRLKDGTMISGMLSQRDSEKVVLRDPSVCETRGVRTRLAASPVDLLEWSHADVYSVCEVYHDPERRWDVITWPNFVHVDSPEYIEAERIKRQAEWDAMRGPSPSWSR